MSNTSNLLRAEGPGSGVTKEKEACETRTLCVCVCSPVCGSPSRREGAVPPVQLCGEQLQHDLLLLHQLLYLLLQRGVTALQPRVASLRLGKARSQARHTWGLRGGREGEGRGRGRGEKHIREQASRTIQGPHQHAHSAQERAETLLWLTQCRNGGQTHHKPGRARSTPATQ